jgi:hypothetical protein
MRWCFFGDGILFDAYVYPPRLRTGCTTNPRNRIQAEEWNLDKETLKRSALGGFGQAAMGWE